MFRNRAGFQDAIHFQAEVEMVMRSVMLVNYEAVFEGRGIITRGL
jgi:hypothetical protein